MQDYQQRVVDEKKDLSIKIVELTKFIEQNELFNTLQLIEQNYLIAQRSAMMEYSNILRKRIDGFISAALNK